VHLPPAGTMIQRLLTNVRRLGKTAWQKGAVLILGVGRLVVLKVMYLRCFVCVCVRVCLCAYVMYAVLYGSLFLAGKQCASSIQPKYHHVISDICLCQFTCVQYNA
jgi:hypothetical protein